MKSIDHLISLTETLAIEREEDLRQYRETVLKRSLKERVEKGVTWHPCELRHLNIGLGERIVVDIDRPTGKKTKDGVFQVGSIVQVFGMIAGEKVGTASGVIARMWPNRMRIRLSSERIPDWITGSKLGIDLDFDDKTYREMANALTKVVKAEKNRLAELREIMVGDKMPGRFEWEHVKYQNPALNGTQNEAIQHVLEARDVAVIHGPPGTGKTTTLVYAIQEILHHEQQVLVCAPSNTAVDLITLKLLELGIDVLRLGNPARVEEELLAHTLDGSIAKHPDHSALKKLRKDAEDVRMRALKFKRKFGSQEQQKRRELLKEARELSGLAHKLEDYILHDVLRKVQVVACTLTGASANLLEGKKFHTVLIDEAAQALEPSCWIAIQKANRVVMVGDHCQLPPTVKSYEAEKRGLGVTLFEHVITQKDADVMLNQQYRMHRKIMQFSADEFYGGKLYADNSVANRSLGPGYQPVEFVDTAGCGFDEVKDSESRSTRNPEEANLLLRHLAMLVNKLSEDEIGAIDDNLRLGIITPYKRQVLEIKSQLSQSPMLSPLAPSIKVSTVDGFQGQEMDIIYISLVRANGKHEIGFLKDIRRMNVSLTRAKRKMVIIGDSATFGNHPFYSRMLNYFETIGAYHSAWEWMDV
ncbi:AAA domain-containing protein [Pontibacter sp. G13]|uniref:AAA domain-containing protein n=1 Tax=Pontibacter sp. G13 TaxID=3074898 RepID=UPI00288BF458|nr:AAA domain-containing protein [Pontibacter sp. G13]WNJ21233.1 AAA domain-containing protein [Pontibacter sp. G13]